MSTIVFYEKSVALACGLRWSVLAEMKKSQTNSEIRKTAETVAADLFAIDLFEEAKYLGLYTKNISITANLTREEKRSKVHSLALVFISAIEQSSDVDRSSIYAILVATPPTDKQGETRSVVIIEGGRVVHDGIESRVRATELVMEHRARQLKYRVFCDLDEYEDAITVDWSDLVEYADKNTLCSPVPTNPAKYLAIALGVLGLSLYGAYHVLVVIPEKEAEAARRQAELDKTPIYLQTLGQEMERVGWSVDSINTFIDKVKQEPYFHKGWSLKSMDCNISQCNETWERHGGLLTDLLEIRSNSRYVPEESVSDKTAVVHTPNKGDVMKLTMDMLPQKGIPVHVALKPALNTLENAGATAQISETMTWPVMPMDGVRPEVVVRRTRLELTYKLSMIQDGLKRLPKNFVPESLVISANQGMSISVRGFVYEK